MTIRNQSKLKNNNNHFSFLQLCLAITLLLCVGATFGIAAADDGSQNDGQQTSEEGTSTMSMLPEELSAEEKIRRQEQVLLAEQAESKAASLIKDSQFEKGIEKLKEAKQHYKKAGQTEPLQKQVKKLNNRLPDAYLQWARHLAQQGKELAQMGNFEEARDKVQQAAEIAPTKGPAFKKTQDKIQKLRQESEVAAATKEEEIMPEKEERDQEIEILLKNGITYFKNDQLMKARENFGKILGKNPYHKKANAYMEKLNEKLIDTGEKRRKVTRKEMQAEGTWTWSQPVRAVRAERDAVENGKKVKKQRNDIEKKLEEIVIPHLEFEEATIAQVITYLRDKSRQLDPDGEGVNFFLMSGKGESGTGKVKKSAEEFSFEGEDESTGETEGAGAAPSGIAGKTVTMSMDNMPLGQAIEYITRGANLTYQIESNAVIIAPEGYTTKEIKTRFYAVKAGIFTGAPQKQDSGGGSAWGMESDSGGGSGGGEDVSGSKVKEYFKDKGVEFPEGASISFDQRSGKLIVSNTEDNLQRIETILQELNVTPTQVTIEAKFVEVNQTDLEELGMEWAITNPLGPDAGYVDPADAPPNVQTSNSDTMINPDGYVPTYDPTATVGESSLMSGVRTISQIADSNDFSNLPDEAQLSLNAVLGAMDVAALIHAVDQAESSDVLSAPRVTTTSGDTATMNIGKERYFPEDWEEPEINTEGDSGNVSRIPSSPNFGDPTQLGVLLEVTPQVQADGTTVALDIHPQVKTFLGYDKSFNTSPPGGLEFKYNMPIIAKREVETNVIVYDGETVVLGGLIKEEIREFEDKLPILGDIPMVGRFFTNKGKSSVKRNLLIFITARLVNPAGQPQREIKSQGLPTFKR